MFPRHFPSCAGRGRRRAVRRSGPVPAAWSPPRPGRCRQQHPIGGAMAQQVAGVGAIGAARRQHRVPGGHVGNRLRTCAGGGGSGVSAMTVSARCSVARRSSSATTPSITPWRCRFSAVCTPAGNGWSYSNSYTRGPRNPIRAPGSATVTWPSEPQDAKTLPWSDCAGRPGREVGLPVQFDSRGNLDHLQERDRALLHAGTAGARRRQQRQPFGRRALHRSGDPFGRGHADRAARNVKSQTATATRRPKTRPSPVDTDSSRPLAVRASASSRA